MAAEPPASAIKPQLRYRVRDSLGRLIPLPLMERVWLRVEPETNGCWIWKGYIGDGGYGLIVLDRRRRVHRYLYEEFIGPVPDGLVLDHLCRVRHCVNPTHLEVVTQGENLRRGMGFPGINARKTHCPQGHPYEGRNLKRNAGKRQCRICQNQHVAEWREKRRAQAA